MKNRYKYLLLCIVSVTFASCGEADVNEPRGSKAIPAQITVAEVKNYPGRSVIRYSLPDDQNLKYVKGIYTPRKGQTTDVKASFYADSIVVEGFASEGTYDVKLYSVSYGETESQPVLATVSPQKPPFASAGESLHAIASFGGMYVEFESSVTSELAIVTVKKDQGVWVPVHTYYSSRQSGSFAVRGQASVETEFAIYVRDRWGNTSPMIEYTITPWFEEMCDKTLFRASKLPGDSWQSHTWSTPESKLNAIEKMWDGVLYADPCYQSLNDKSPMPEFFTIDLGRKYQLSRFVVNSRYYDNGKYDNVFKAGHPKEIELWGSNNPNPDGSFDASWTLISPFTSTRPSGETVAWSASSPLTDEDKQAAYDGDEYVIPEGALPYRYVRFKTLSTWGNLDYTHMTEMTFFGATVNE